MHYFIIVDLAIREYSRSLNGDNGGSSGLRLLIYSVYELI